MHAAVALRTMGPAATQREADRNIIAAVDEVSQQLGNTRAVCRKYYVHPAIIEAYYQGRTVPLAAAPPVKEAPRGKRVAALRREELAVLQFLQDELAA
jgi:DNA topoisomerase-1